MQLRDGRRPRPFVSLGVSELIFETADGVLPKSIIVLGATPIVEIIRTKFPQLKRQKLLFGNGVKGAYLAPIECRMWNPWKREWESRVAQPHDMAALLRSLGCDVEVVFTVLLQG